jgi:hypothetical protein
MKTRILVLSALLPFLFGCTAAPTKTMFNAGSTSAITKKGAEEGPSEAGPEIYGRMATRGFLDTSKEVPRGYGAYGYLVFTSNPRLTAKERYAAVCSVFVAHLEASRAKSKRERASEMITFWPLRPDFLAEAPECKDALENYDTAFAGRIAAAVRKQGVRGPLLVAWPTPFGKAGSEALVLDMSSFSNDDLSRAIRIWKDRISMDPTMWQSGWKAVQLKEELRNGIENILPGVVTVVGAWFPKPSK